MKTFLAVLALITAPVQTSDVVKNQPRVASPASVVQPAPLVQPASVVVLPFENLGIFDELPDYVKNMPKDVYIKWAKAQNEMALRKAQQKSDEWISRNPLLETYVQYNNYTSTSSLTQAESATSTGASVNAESGTSYNGYSMQRTFRDPNRWGGGPVVLINPYVRK